MRPWEQYEIQEAKLLRCHGQEVTPIAQRLGRTQEDVNALFTRLQDRGECTPKQARRARILQLWGDGEPLRSVAETVDCSYYYAGTVIRTALRLSEEEFLLVLNPQTGYMVKHNLKSPEGIGYLLGNYRSRKSIPKLAAYFDCSENTIKRALYKQGIDVRERQCVGA